MARLGEILIERGLLSPDGLRAGLEACRRHGGRLGTWLVRLGLINEAALLDALSTQTSCPAASALELATASAQVRSAIPQALARRHLVVPFARQGRALDVAMANPKDLVLLDEISKLTGATIRPHVATEAALTAALALPGPNASATPTATNAAAPAPVLAQREWRQFWRLESATTELMRALETPAPEPVPHQAATFPYLAPLGASAPAPAANDTQELADSLSVATHRDQVASLVVDSLVEEKVRVAMFSVHQNKVMAWVGRGLGLVDDDFHTLILPLDRPSIFLNLSENAELHVGPLIGGEGNGLLLAALGTPVAQQAVVVPLRVRGKLAGFLWLDKGEENVADLPIVKVREIGRLIGLTLEILVLRQKIKAGALDRTRAED